MSFYVALLAAACCLLYVPVGVSARVLTPDWAVDNLPSHYDDQGLLQVTCTTGSDIAAAFALPDVQSVLIAKDITMADSDWANYTLPVTLTRNVTVRGPANWPLEEWPTLDMAFVKGKVALGPGVLLEFTQIVLVNTRQVPYFQSPGFDLLVTKRRNASASEAPGLLYFRNSTGIQRTCMPESRRDESISSYPRPKEVPGAQIATELEPPTPCINSSSPDVPAMKRCWGVYGMYQDFAGYGTALDEVAQVPKAQNYVFRLIDTFYVCRSRMPEDCVAEAGLIGCYYRLFPKDNSSTSTESLFKQPPPPQQQQPQHLGPPPVGSAGDIRGSSANGRSPGSSDGNDLLAPLLGGLLGGAAFVAIVVASMVFLVRRKRQGSGGSSSRDQTYYTVNPESGMKLSPESGETFRTAPDSNETRTGAAYISSYDTTAGGFTCGGSEPPSTTGGQHTTPRGLEMHYDQALVPVTALSPVLPDVNLAVNLATEVQLTDVTLGAGTFGRVVKGLYGGTPVAVKLVKTNNLWVAGAAVHPGSRQMWPPEAAMGCSEPSAASLAAVDGAAGGAAALGKPPAVSQHGLQQMQQQQVKQIGTATQENNEALVQEVEVLARCQHPNIVRLLAASVKHPQLCLVMELMDSSLERMLYGKGDDTPNPMLLPKMLHIAIQIARALSYLHPTILHRDLKPANILIKGPDGDDSVAKLADFGLSRLLSTVLITKNPEVGTAPYMAPETFDLENMLITDRSDIYSLGVILYEMLSGKKPWKGMNIVQIAYAVTVQGVRPPIHDLPETRCPHKLRSLVLSCWEADPRRRPAAAEVVKVLALVQEELAAATQ